jgi:hypothetical protein
MFSSFFPLCFDFEHAYSNGTVFCSWQREYKVFYVVNVNLQINKFCGFFSSPSLFLCV